MTSPVQQGATGTATIASGTASTPLASNTTLGNSVVAVIEIATNGADNVSAISSPIGTFTKAVAEDVAGSNYNPIEIWVCENVTGASTSITVTTANANALRVALFEWPGQITGTLVTASSSGDSVTPSVSITPGSTGQVVMAAYISNGGANTAHPGSPWVEMTAVGYWGAGGYFDVVWQTAASTGALTASWTVPVYDWTTVAVAFTLKSTANSNFFAFMGA